MMFYILVLVAYAQEIQEQPKPAPVARVTTKDVCGNVFVNGVALHHPLTYCAGNVRFVFPEPVSDPSRVSHGYYGKVPEHESPR